MTAILLFAAFAFFAFAQAASARNGAQSAADAAALAAAQSARDELMDTLGQTIGTDDDWLDTLLGQELPWAEQGTAASNLASQNDAHLISGPNPVVVNEFPGYKVEVETNYTVGDTVIPGTESRHAKASATAVLEPRCEIPTDADPKKPVRLNCDGTNIEIDPGGFDPGDLPDASTLFSVHLAD